MPHYFSQHQPAGLMRRGAEQWTARLYRRFNF